jgi:DnaJ-class molecular chaperone
MSAEHRNSQDVLRTARLFTDGESIEQIQARLAKARLLAFFEKTPRSGSYEETEKTRRWWVRAFEQILEERGAQSGISMPTNETMVQRTARDDHEEGRQCGRCGGSGSIGGRHLVGLAEQAADQFGDAGKIDCPTCGGSGRIP